ncbi:hypothetical protein E4T56_gene16675 [Termitomyces sp. T112]|nr:hypothetical protein E4T56_gene16675 [Termitomyces sp. T112]
MGQVVKLVLSCATPACSILGRTGTLHGHVLFELFDASTWHSIPQLFFLTATDTEDSSSCRVGTINLGCSSLLQRTLRMYDQS